MDETTTTSASAPSLGDWSDPIEDGVRGRVRAFIEAILEEELEAALGRARYERTDEGPRGWRNGHRERQVIGTFGPETVRVPRARLMREEGGTAEWRSKGLRRYQRLTKRAEALIAGAYLAGTNTRRVRRALAALFDGAVGKDVVSRAWRKVKTDWEAWNARDLGAQDIARLILDGTVVRVKIDRKATAISLLVAVGVRRDGQKVLLALKSMGGESTVAWTAFLEDMTRRGLEGARAPHRRRRARARGGAGGAVARRPGPAVHGSQAPQPARPRPEAAPRRADRRLPVGRQPSWPGPTTKLAGLLAAAVGGRAVQAAPLWLSSRLSVEAVAGTATSPSFRLAAALRR